MENSTHAIIQLLNGDGIIPDGFEESLDEIQIAGLQVRVLRIGKKQIRGGPPIGLILTIPKDNIKQLGQDNQDFLSKVKELFRANNENCNFGVCIVCLEGDRKIDIHVSSKEIKSDCIDKFFYSFAGSLGDFIANLDMPNRITVSAFINYDITNEKIRDVTCFDTNQDFYVYNMGENNWVIQEKPEPHID